MFVVFVVAISCHYLVGFRNRNLNPQNEASCTLPSCNSIPSRFFDRGVGPTLPRLCDELLEQCWAFEKRAQFGYFVFYFHVDTLKRNTWSVQPATSRQPNSMHSGLSMCWYKLRP